MGLASWFSHYGHNVVELSLHQQDQDLSVSSPFRGCVTLAKPVTSEPKFVIYNMGIIRPIFWSFELDGKEVKCVKPFAGCHPCP